MKKIYSLSISVLCILFFTRPAFAHVIVNPNHVGIAQTQVFTMSVPDEKDTPTTGIRLVIPEGLQQVVPNVKQGWSINIVKKGDVVTEIDWTGGSIPPDQRDEFLFEAQAPAKIGILKWKAYQTFADGSSIAWDHNPTANPEDDAAPPPYSQTKVINDLQGSDQNNLTVKESAGTADASQKLPVQLISIAALALSAISLGLSFMRRKKS